MNQDPYAPESAYRDALPPSPTGPPAPWNASEVISAARARFRESLLPLVGSYWLVMIVGNLPAEIGAALIPGKGTTLHSAPGGVLGVSLWLVTIALSSFFQIGLIRLFLQVARGETPRFGALFSGADLVLPMLGLNVLMMLGVGLGMVLLIVPGLLLALGWSLAPYFLVDANLGPVEALRASWDATKGQRGELCFLFLALFGIGLLGMLFCCVGLIAAAPLTLLAMAIAFTRISGRSPALPPGPPPMGWGAPPPQGGA